MEQLTSQIVKEYELQERIGKGGFGEVYRAYQANVAREVAIKIISSEFAQQPDFIRRFESEAQLVARLEHMNIVPLYDYWRDPQGAYLVMRWLRGGSLAESLKLGAYDLEAAAKVISQITSALSTSHRQNIIHRDIKPANILLDEDGNAYLTDFGIAKDYNRIDGSVTGVDVIIGSLDYIAPEQARGVQVTPRTDIYSLGVVLYEMLVGVHPFPNLNSVERMYKHLNEPLPEIKTLPARVASDLNGVVQKATAKNPDDRYADTVSFATAFLAAGQLNRQPILESVVSLLTPREQEILQLMINGRSNHEIAEALFVTVSTVKWHQKQLYGKLRVRNRIQAIVRARDLDLVLGEGDLDIPLIERSTIISSMTETENPYKGLRAFQSADSHDFFGRENITDKLMARLAESGKWGRFLAVVGPSGSGKSSLVKAGVIPALWRGDLAGSDRWFTVEILPGAHPLDELEVGLLRVSAHPGRLKEHLESDGRGLLRASQLILPDDGSELVLIIDQFEEVFTLVEDEAQRAHFLDLLFTTASDPRSRVRIIVTLRADFYDRPLRYPDFGEMLRERMETVLPLSAEELERAISSPAGRVGVKFEEGLVASIIAEVNYQPGALPLLQYALTELFERRQKRTLTQEAYRQMGCTVGALAKRADELYLELDEVGQETVRQMFLRLVTLGEGVEDTRRRVPRAELLAITDQRDLMDEVIDTYSAYRLLSLDHDLASRRPMVEVAHEAILREWERLRNWVNESREEIRMQQQLDQMAREWQTASRDNSYLVQGLRLEQFETWVGDTTLALSDAEREYLDASLAYRETLQTREAAQLAREAHLQGQANTRLRYLVAAMSLFLVVAVGLSLFAFEQQSHAKSSLKTAVAAQATEASRADESQSLVMANLAERFVTDDPPLALALALEALNMPEPPFQARQPLEAALRTTPRRMFVSPSVLQHRSVAVSPDGQTVLAASRDRTLVLWDMATGELLRTFSGHSDIIYSDAFSPDGQTILSASGDGTLILWDVATAEPLRTFSGHSGIVTRVVFSPDGQTALSASYDRTLILWDVATAEPLRTFSGHSGIVHSVVFSPDGLTALSGSDDGTLILWDVATAEPLRTFSGHSRRVNSVVFSPDGQTALSGSDDSTLILWDIATGEPIRTFSGHSAKVKSAVFSPNGQTAMSASDDSTLILWDVRTGEPLRTVESKKCLCGYNDVVFSPDGASVLVAQDASLFISLWDIGISEPPHIFSGHLGKVNSAVFSPDGTTALSASRDKTLILWDIATGVPLHTFSAQAGQVNSVAFSPDGTTAVSAMADKTVILWDIASGQPLHIFRGHSVQVNSVAFSPDGQTILSASGDKTLILWDVVTGELLRTFRGHSGVVQSVAFSPDGQTALSASFDKTLILWSVASGEPIRIFEGHTGAVYSVAFSPDGQTALSAGDDRTVILWDVANGQPLRVFRGFLDSITMVTFSPDGQTALLVSTDKTVILWNVTTGKPQQILSGHTSTINSAVFSLDGKSVLSASDDNTLRLWRIVPLADLIAQVYQNWDIHELTCEERLVYNTRIQCDADGIFPTATLFVAAVN